MGKQVSSSGQVQAASLTAPRTLVERMSSSATRTAVDEGQASSEIFLRRSGAVHVGYVLLLAFVAFAGSEPGISGALLEGKALVCAALLLFGVGTLLLPGSSAAALVGLGLLAAGGGGLLALLDAAPLQGLGATFALSVTLAEVSAFTLVLAGRSTLAAPVSLAVAAATTGALAYLLDGGLAASTSLGVAGGGAIAIAFVLHARYAEGAVTLRHASHQVAQAALTRWLEGPRGLLLLLHTRN